MRICLRVALFFSLVAATLTQDGFDLADAFDDTAPTTTKPKEKPKVEDPKSGGGLDLLDAFGPAEPTQKPKKPSSGDSGGFGFDLNDALGPDTNPKPDKPAINEPNSDRDSGNFGDSDLTDISAGDYKPDNTGGGRGRAADSGYDQGGADQPQAEAGSGQIAGIVSAIGVALVGAASSYFAYQKKKLCFKLQGGADPESGKGQLGTNSEPQVFSDLLRTN